MRGLIINRFTTGLASHSDRPAENVVAGNYIGTDAQARASHTTSSASPSPGRLETRDWRQNASECIISGNQNGITINGAAAPIPQHDRGTYIGANATGDGAIDGSGTAVSPWWFEHHHHRR